MSQFSDYLLGQALTKLDSLKSDLGETDEKIDTLTERVDEALSWAQRLICLGLACLGTLVLNWSPDKIGEALALALKNLK